MNIRKLPENIFLSHKEKCKREVQSCNIGVLKKIATALLKQEIDTSAFRHDQNSSTTESNRISKFIIKVS